ncbi:MAG: hypothetical protein E6J90_33795 [Deltaproteobacteria bacterium]|nr:MAG: hypothetical protein E6J90_33795 [Deltaproteobacteria bacterium]
MIRHGGVTFLVVVAAAAGCGASRPANRGANELSLSRAAAVGEFSDNPLLASVPADTAYAFASFKPVSPDFVHAIRTAFSGMWHREFQRDLQNDEEGAERARAFEQWLAGLDARRLDELGFSSRARFVLYGLQGYPVLRIELSNGDRVVELVERTAKDWRVKLPPHIDHVGRRYWITDISDAGMLIAVGRTEAVIAVAPHDVIERNLGALVGGQRPAKSLTTAQFRELAARDGFTGQALGFLDLPRASAMFAEAAGVKPECRAAIVDVARSLPRLVIGFDDLTAHRMAMGLVLELAPDLLADVRGLAIPLAGYTRMIDRNPAMAVAVAADVERGRALAARGLVALRHVGERCKNPKFVGMTSFLAVAVARPLPAMLAGLRGGFMALDSLQIGPRGPTSIDGYGLIQIDHPEALLKQIAEETPGFVLPRDGVARALPPMLGYPGHAAASDSAIGVALGRNSATAAAELLKARPAPAPLAFLSFDYRRLGELVLRNEHGKDLEDMRDVVQSFGQFAFQLVVDDRGPVLWTSIELR